MFATRILPLLAAGCFFVSTLAAIEVGELAKDAAAGKLDARLYRTGPHAPRSASGLYQAIKYCHRYRPRWP